MTSNLALYPEFKTKKNIHHWIYQKLPKTVPKHTNTKCLNWIDNTQWWLTLSALLKSAIMRNTSQKHSGKVNMHTHTREAHCHATWNKEKERMNGKWQTSRTDRHNWQQQLPLQMAQGNFNYCPVVSVVDEQQQQRKWTHCWWANVLMDRHERWWWWWWLTKVHQCWPPPPADIWAVITTTIIPSSSH